MDASCSNLMNNKTIIKNTLEAVRMSKVNESKSRDPLRSSIETTAVRRFQTIDSDFNHQCQTEEFQ